MEEEDYYKYYPVTDETILIANQFELLPNKVNAPTFHGREYGEKYWSGSYSRAVDNLNKVKLDKFIGRKIDDVVSMYMPRYRKSHAEQYVGNKGYVGHLLGLFGVHGSYRDSDGTIMVFANDRWSYRVEPLKSGRSPSYLFRHQNSPVSYIHPETGCLLRYKRKVKRTSKKDKIAWKLWNIEKQASRMIAKPQVDWDAVLRSRKQETKDRILDRIM